MDDPHAKLFDELFRQVLDGPGESAPELRRAAARNQDVPADLQALVEKVHKHAYKVTDEDVARLLARADAALYRAKHQGRDRVEASPGAGAATQPQLL